LKLVEIGAAICNVGRFSFDLLIESRIKTLSP